MRPRAVREPSPSSARPSTRWTPPGASYAGFSLRDECFGAPQERLDEVQLAQPVIFMIEVALTELLRSWGVRPACVIGHSAGEVAAAYAAGIYSLAEATRLIFHRAVQQQRTAGSGRMLAVGLDRAATEELLRAVVDRRAAGRPSRSPARTRRQARWRAAARQTWQLAAGLLAQRGVAAPAAARQRRLPLARDGRHRGGPAGLRSPSSTPSRLTAARPVHLQRDRRGHRTLDAAYWWANVRRPVRFAAAVATAARDFRPDVVLEVSPHAALPAGGAAVPRDAAPVRPAHPRAGRLRAHAGPGRGLARCLSTEALGALYREGVSLDFAGAVSARPAGQPPAAAAPRDERRLMDRPGRRRAVPARAASTRPGPLLGRRLPGDRPRFEVRMSAADFPWLADHRVQHTADHARGGLRRDDLAGARRRARALSRWSSSASPACWARSRSGCRPSSTPEPGDRDAYAFRITSSSYAGDFAGGRATRACCTAPGGSGGCPPRCRHPGRRGRRARPVPVHRSRGRAAERRSTAHGRRDRGVLPVRTAFPGGTPSARTRARGNCCSTSASVTTSGATASGLGTSCRPRCSTGGCRRCCITRWSARTSRRCRAGWRGSPSTGCPPRPACSATTRRRRRRGRMSGGSCRCRLGSRAAAAEPCTMRPPGNAWLTSACTWARSPIPGRTCSRAAGTGSAGSRSSSTRPSRRWPPDPWPPDPWPPEPPVAGAVAPALNLWSADPRSADPRPASPRSTATRLAPPASVT